ncbi:potassium transporter TrkA [Microvirga tunisiensis]|uniref:Potassium transporter TrkA n=2 Tax=Pannonibacter tanglangensis TaxID=2750084 RepID=A0ABW9ZNY7_9HYPH|nr:MULTISPECIES: monovalent cation:proton antiporter-2 (CPA2) family protein [unclassified Pannonibacter]NBN64440.1 potassium transporter TrkA [Pannonibacter sp. XCT-34]NBN78972.1 potassium transporter TrkA [Pannonibacter sp. XCT-53]
MAAEAAPPLFNEAILFLAATVVAVPLARRLGLGSVVGYLAAGLAIGPYGLNAFGAADAILPVAELGVVLLLFMIGLELDAGRLWRMRRDILGLGGAQVLVTGALLTLLLRGAGASWPPALIAGLGLALSSTAFALQILQERGQLATPYGQRGFAILLFQDIAIVPLLALVAILAPAGAGPASGSALAEVGVTVLAVVAVILAGRYLVSPVFLVLARSRAREVMLAAALLVALGSAGIMQMVGLSMALGAFLAGVLLAESSFRHTLEADIEPFRSLLMGLFFVAVGMSLDLGYLAGAWHLVALAVPVLMLVKGAVLWGLARLFGSTNADALRIAVTLPQGGEFAFVLFSAAVLKGVIAPDLASLLTATVILSMLFTPLACLGLDRVAARLQPAGGGHAVVESFGAAVPVVLIVGFGRFGRTVAQILTSEGLAVTAIDNDPDRLAYARALGYRVSYGDATRQDVLSAAGAADAAMIALCVESETVMQQAILALRRLNPAARLYCRATNRHHALALTRLGVEYQIRETFESSLAFGRAALAGLGIPPDRIAQIEEDVRRRDGERMALQLEQGEDAGNDRLHAVTPRRPAGPAGPGSDQDP